MILYSIGKNDTEYSEISKEFLAKLEEGSILDSSNNKIYKLNTVFRNISDKINDVAYDLRKRKFLKIFQEEDFKTLKNIILAKPNELEEYIIMIDSISAGYGLDKLTDEEKVKWKNELLEIVAYKKFDDIIGREWYYDIMRISVCVYCNQEKIIKINNMHYNGELVLMEIDHYLEKSKYPLFSMSFFNLLISCTNCNQKLKKPIQTKPSTHIHPYLDSLHDEAKFVFTPSLKTFPNKIKINLIENKSSINEGKTKLTIKDYRLNDLYTKHEDEVLTMIKVYKRYNKPTSIYFGFFLSKKLNIKLFDNDENIESYKMDYKVPINSEDVGKTYLGKLKHDVFENLK